MVPTVLGTRLVEAFLLLDASLVRPALRASMEAQVASIADGKAEAHVVLAENLDLFRNKFRAFQSRFDKAFHLFDGSELRDAPKSRDAIGLVSFMDTASKSRLLALQLQKQEDEEAMHRLKGQRHTQLQKHTQLQMRQDRKKKTNEATSKKTAKKMKKKKTKKKKKKEEGMTTTAATERTAATPLSTSGRVSFYTHAHTHTHTLTHTHN
jgi:hypothetical protein